MKDGIRVREAVLEDDEDIERLFVILDAYAPGPGGQNAPLPASSREALGPGLRAAPNALVLFGEQAGEVVGGCGVLLGVFDVCRSAVGQLA